MGKSLEKLMLAIIAVAVVFLIAILVRKMDESPQPETASIIDSIPPSPNEASLGYVYALGLAIPLAEDPAVFGSKYYDQCFQHVRDGKGRAPKPPTGKFNGQWGQVETLKSDCHSSGFCTQEQYLEKKVEIHRLTESQTEVLKRFDALLLYGSYDIDPAISCACHFPTIERSLLKLKRSQLNFFLYEQTKERFISEFFRMYSFYQKGLYYPKSLAILNLHLNYIENNLLFWKQAVQRFPDLVSMISPEQKAMLSLHIDFQKLANSMMAFALKDFSCVLNTSTDGDREGKYWYNLNRISPLREIVGLKRNASQNLYLQLLKDQLHHPCITDSPINCPKEDLSSMSTSNPLINTVGEYLAHSLTWKKQDLERIYHQAIKVNELAN